MKKYLFGVVAVVGVALPRSGWAVPFVYVANADSNNVTVIDAATDTVATTIAVGSEPRNPAVNRDGTRVYVPNRFSDSVTVINGVTNTVITTISSVGDEPYSAAVGSDGTRVYVANKSDNTLAVIDATNNTMLTTISDSCFDSPEWVIVNPAGTRAYVVNRQGDSVCVVNTGTNTVVDQVSVGSAPRSAVVTCDGSFVYVANNSGSPDISKIRTSDNSVVAGLSFSGGSPRNISLSPDGKKIYVGLQNANIGVINVSTDTTSTIAMPGGSSSYATATLANGSKVYVTDESNDEVQVLNASTGSFLTGGGYPISAGNTPRGLATAFTCAARARTAPAVSSAGLVALALMLGLGGLWVLRQRMAA